MKDFNFYAPTRVVFGRESEEKLPQLIQQYGGKKVLVHYGGGSAKRSGLLDKVFTMLDDAGIVSTTPMGRHDCGTAFPSQKSHTSPS